MQLKNWIRKIFFIICLGVMLISAYQVFSIWKASNESQNLNEDLQQAVHIIDGDQEHTQSSRSEELQPETSMVDGTDETSEIENSPVEADFDQLHEQNQDIIAWIYLPDTELNYPIAQSSDNDYYLRRLLDGNYNVAGTIFADYRNAADFSDWSTLIYGHNMKNHTMFGLLPEYQNQAYYEAHPVMYLMTPSQNYRIDLIGGFVTSTEDSLYGAAGTKEERDHLIEEAKTLSDFTADVEVGEDDRLITLSTCAYEFQNARYVLIGKLVPLN